MAIAPKILVRFAESHPNRCIRIKYENLISTPETIIAQICKFANIEFNHEMLEYNGIESVKWKFGDQTRLYSSSKPHNHSVDSWIKDMSSGPKLALAASYMEDLTKSTIQKMGYNVEDMKRELNITKLFQKTEFKCFFKSDKISDTAQLHTEINYLKEQINRMQNTLSWRLTKFFRNSKIVSLIVKRTIQ